MTALSPNPVDVQVNVQEGVDVAMAVTVLSCLQTEPKITDVVLFAGDGDLKPLVQRLRNLNMRVWLIAQKDSVNLEMKSLVCLYGQPFIYLSFYYLL